MSEATDILAAAHARAARRDRATPQVDYTALNQMVRRQRAALTRAVNSGDPDRVVVACRNAVREWNAPNAIWPDDWTRWQRALDDTLPFNARVELSDLH